MLNGILTHHVDNIRQFGHTHDKSTGVSNGTNANHNKVERTRFKIILLFTRYKFIYLDINLHG